MLIFIGYTRQISRQIIMITFVDENASSGVAYRKGTFCYAILEFMVFLLTTGVSCSI